MEFRSMEEDKIKNLHIHTIQNTTNSPHMDPAWLAYAKIRSSGKDKTVQQWSNMAGLCKDQKFRKRQDSTTVIKHGWLMQRSEVPEETIQYNSDQAWLAYAKIRSSGSSPTTLEHQRWTESPNAARWNELQMRKSSNHYPKKWTRNEIIWHGAGGPREAINFPNVPQQHPPLCHEEMRCSAQKSRLPKAAEIHPRCIRWDAAGEPAALQVAKQPLHFHQPPQHGQEIRGRTCLKRIEETS